jgi:hypothetical protein
VLGRRRKSVLAVTHVHVAGVSRQDFFLRAPLRSEPPRHLFFDPHGEPHLLRLARDHVGIAPPEHERHRLRQPPEPLEQVAVFQRCQPFQKMTADQLLRDGRSTLREDGRRVSLVAGAVAQEPRRQRRPPDPRQHARNRGVVDAVVIEEPLVFRRQNRLADDDGNVLVPRDRSMLACELDQRLPVRVVHMTDAEEFEAGEWIDVRQAGAVVVDVGEDKHDGDQHRQRRDAEEPGGGPRQARVPADVPDRPVAPMAARRDDRRQAAQEAHD